VVVVAAGAVTAEREVCTVVEVVVAGVGSVTTAVQEVSIVATARATTVRAAKFFIV